MNIVCSFVRAFGECVYAPICESVSNCMQTCNNVSKNEPPSVKAEYGPALIQHLSTHFTHLGVFERLPMDLLGAQTAKAGQQYILLVAHSFSRRVDAFAHEYQINTTLCTAHFTRLQ